MGERSNRVTTYTALHVQCPTQSRLYLHVLGMRTKTCP